MLMMNQSENNEIEEIVVIFDVKILGQ